MNEELRDSFLKTAESWLCDGYFFDLRYLCVREGAKDQLFAALIAVNPLPPKANVGFTVEAGRVSAGQVQLRAGSDLTSLLTNACAGQLATDGLRASFDDCSRIEYFSDNPDPNRPGVDLHLRVIGANQLSFSLAEVLDTDGELRRTNPPFDGLADLCNWLGLQNPASSGRQSLIDIRINPPVDFGDELRLENNLLYLTFRALATLELDALELGIRAAPGVGLARFLAGKKIQWAPPHDGMKTGSLEMHIEEADVVQCMLTLGPRMIRRHVLVDRTRARTLRLAAVMAMDPGLVALSNSLRASDRDRDATRFEKAVATLLFLNGFIPTPQADTNAPDLLVGTPGGRLALVECTLRISDVNGKVAKLAARRNHLVSELRAKGHATDVHAVLVCASPRSEIVGLNEIELANQSVTLVGGDILQLALQRIQSTEDPDALLVRASAALVETQRRSIPL